MVLGLLVEPLQPDGEVLLPYSAIHLVFTHQVSCELSTRSLPVTPNHWLP